MVLPPEQGVERYISVGYTHDSYPYHLFRFAMGIYSTINVSIFRILNLLLKRQLNVLMMLETLLLGYRYDLWLCIYQQRICDGLNAVESWKDHAYPDSKVYGANVGPIWGRQVPGGPHVGPINLAIWVYNVDGHTHRKQM